MDWEMDLITNKDIKSAIRAAFASVYPGATEIYDLQDTIEGVVGEKWATMPMPHCIDELIKIQFYQLDLLRRSGIAHCYYCKRPFTVLSQLPDDEIVPAANFIVKYSLDSVKLDPQELHRDIMCPSCQGKRGFLYCDDDSRGLVFLDAPYITEGQLGRKDEQPYAP